MRKLILPIFVMLSLNMAYSQSVTPDVIASSGDYREGSTASVSWTLGEIVTEFFSGSEAILTQGFQQGSYSITILDENTELSIQIDVYPVPTSDFINININEMEEYSINAVLYDLSGNVLLNQDLHKDEMQLNLEALPAAEYILQIIDDKQILIKSFKIIKY